MKHGIAEDIVNWFEADNINHIDEVISNGIPKYSAIICSNRIIRLLQLRNKKYETVEEYMSDIGYCDEDIEIFNLNKEKEKKEYVGKVCELNYTQIKKEDIINDIIYWFKEDTNEFVNEVMNDDELNPEYSAVTCSNRIIRIIQLQNKENREYETIEDYLKALGYCDEDIERFMLSRESEKEIYIGDIYEL